MPIQLTQKHLNYMNLGRRYQCATLGGLTKSQKEGVSSYVTNLEAYLRVGMGAFLWGPNRSGKTYISAALCKAVWGRYRVSSYSVSAEELKECWIHPDIEAHPGSSETMLDRVKAVRFLIIDDLAKEYRTASGFSENKLGALIRMRQKDLKITTITTNLSPDQFEKVYGKSSFELVREIMLPCKIDGENMRERVLTSIKQQLETKE